jgi:hypothetical protein
MAILSFTTFFDINQRKVRIQDTSNYSGQGIPLTNIKGVIKVTSPRGVIYNNTNYTTPDVNPNSSLFSGYITLPHNRDGYILAGTYTIQYSVLNSGDNSVSSHSNTYTYSFIVPQITINQVVDGYNSTFNSIDTTSYGSYASLSRVHTVTPPSGSPLSSVSNGNQTIGYTPDIWSGDWKSEITSTLVYTEPDGLVLNAVLTEIQTTTAYNNDMNVIRGYIEAFKLLYETARATDKNMAYQIQAGLLKINTAYSEYDLALFYNDLATAYLRTVDIINELNDYITITFPEHILPFVNSTGGSTHPPVSISAPNYGVSVNTSQVLSFTLSTTGHGGMMPILSGNATDYIGGDGAWHSLSSGTYALKSDFTAYDSVRAITATEITNWNTSFGWGNHASAGYAVATDYYTKVNLQTSGQSLVHFGNITNKPTTLAGYGITDSIAGNAPITGATNTKITYDSKGLVVGGSNLLIADIPDLPWSKITTGKPTTLSGYGIVDTYTQTQILNLNWSWGHITSDKPTTLAGYGIADAYTQAQILALTWDFTSKITGKPTTLAGYGITNGLSTSHPANNVINSGLGTLFLSDDGTYKVVGLDGILDTQVVFLDGTTPSGNAGFTFDKTNVRLTSTQILSPTYYIDNTSTSIVKDGSNNMSFTDAVSGTITLASLVAGATNYWSTITGGIYYSNYVGVNNPATLNEALTVNGNVQADYFNSSYLRYKDSNLLLGPNAGDSETGNNLLYIANSNTSSPLIYGDFLNQLLNFNADVYINEIKRLNFGNSDVYLRRDASDNLIFRDLNANGGAEISLTNLTTLTGYALKSDFTSYTSATSITAANIITWNKATILHNSGSASNYLGEDGNYHVASAGGVTPTNNFSKWDTGSSYYRFYTDKTEAGGVSSGGKFYLGTTDPTNTNRLNYDGEFHAQKISISNSGSGNSIYGASGSGIGLQGYSTSGYALYANSGTGVSGIFNNSGGTADIAKFQLGTVDQVVINSSGINLKTGATYKVNGVDILSTLHNPVTLGTANGLSLSTQQLSLGLASTSTTGALSNTDWNTFNNKKPAQSTNLTLNPATTLYFDKDYQYNSYTVASNITLTTSTTNGVALNKIELTLVGDGTHTVAFSGCTQDGSSGNFDNTLGAINKVSFYYDGTAIWYSMPLIVEVEPYLGNPSVNGYVLASTTSGTRSWVANGSGGGTTPLNGLLYWDGTAYNVYGTQQSLLSFDSSVTNPTLTGRLNLNGYLYATKLFSGGVEVTPGVTPIDGIFDWDGTAYNPYSSPSAGKFDNSTNNPTNTNRLNYDGSLYVTSLNVTSNGAINAILSYSSGGQAILGQDNTTGIGVRGTSYLGRAGYFDQQGGANTSADVLYLTRGNSGSFNSTGNFINISDSPITSGTTSGSVLKATIGSTIRIDMNPRVANSGTNTAYILDTHNALTGTTNILSLRNQGVEKFYFDNAGNFGASQFTSGTSTDYSRMAPSYFETIIASSSKMTLNPGVSDGVSALAYKLNTSNTLSTSGSKLLSIQNNSVERFRVTPTNTAIPSGTSTTFSTVGGVLKDFYTDASTSGTGETDLYSYIIPANVLSTNGDKLTFKFTLDTSSSPTSSYVKVYFAGTSRTSINNLLLSGIVNFTITIIRVSSSVCRISYEGFYNSGIGVNDYLEMTSKDWTTTNILKVTGQCATNSIVAKFGTIEYKPAAIN